MRLVITHCRATDISKDHLSGSLLFYAVLMALPEASQIDMKPTNRQIIDSPSKFLGTKLHRGPAVLWQPAQSSQGEGGGASDFGSFKKLSSSFSSQKHRVKEAKDQAIALFIESIEAQVHETFPWSPEGIVTWVREDFVATSAEKKPMNPVRKSFMLR
jgi:hypothetical protein